MIFLAILIMMSLRLPGRQCPGHVFCSPIKPDAAFLTNRVPIQPM